MAQISIGLLILIVNRSPGEALRFIMPSVIAFRFSFVHSPCMQAELARPERQRP